MRNDTTMLSLHLYIFFHFANFAHHTHSTCTLAYSHSLDNYTPRHWALHAHSTPFHIEVNLYVPSSAATEVHNITDTPTCRLSTAHALHSFCIQDRPHSPCSVAIKLQPPTTRLSHACQHALHTQAAIKLQQPSTWLCHVRQHALHTQDHPLHCFPQLSYTHK